MKLQRDTSLYSKKLNRAIVLDIVLPPGYEYNKDKYPVLLMNDGQDLPQLNLVSIIDDLLIQKSIKSFILVAIHCGDRIQEYGTAAQADYQNRGSKASFYSDFVLSELLPYLQQNYRIEATANSSAFCGFSLGGLSAFDIVWHHSDFFGKVGAFSASFWWRQKAYTQNYDNDQDRIIHKLVRQSENVPKAMFWIQTGTEDEKEDRNNNGIIDSIDDALDLIEVMETKGLRRGQDIKYVEVPGGQHNQQTWSAIMPDFLLWAFGI